MNRRAIFVCSQKGGAGKTTFARALVDVLRCEGHTVAAYDADGHVGQLFQHHGLRDAGGALLPGQDPCVGCGFFNIRDDDDRDLLLNALTTAPPLILFDLPGGVVGELGKVLDHGAAPRGLFDEYRDQGYAVTVVVVMTPVQASVRTVQHSIDAFGETVDYVAVLNLAFGDREAFVLFDGCDRDGLRLPTSRGKHALHACGGAIITLPALHPRTYALLDIHNLGFVEAAQDRGPGARLPAADRARVRRWLHEFDGQLVPARHLLGFAAGDAAAPAPEAAA
ncbi:MAG: hypothetical protein EA420_08005 [Candidatus Competibacteraceae bacterium]|nr:MAG: hypothetical protein EA420_08005 [Candidatus Competibacteraceae bacterium]